MLVRFSVQNYRSFRDEQVLSLEAGRQGQKRRGRAFPTGHKAAPNLLHGAVIYGANSGGKSNLVLALAFMQAFVSQSAKSQRGDQINVQPFRLDPVAENEPTQFELIFIVDGSMYQYGFALNKTQVVAEWMYETPNDGRIRNIFSRELSGEKYDWYFNPRLKGEKRLWQQSTRENALLFSTAVQLNSIDLAKPFDWINTKLRVLPGTGAVGDSITSMMCHTQDEKRAVLDILRSVDPGIIDISTKEDDFDEKAIPSELPDVVREKIVSEFSGQKFYSAQVGRKSKNGDKVFFDLDDESAGTNILYEMSGPWIDTLRHGYTLVIDELDSSLHPLALYTLVSLFFDSKRNQSNAQLVITCHEATLLRDNLLRSDQIWFIDKDETQGSRLYPLSEFKPKKNESFLRGYLGGRYGAVPLTRSIGIDG